MMSCQRDYDQCLETKILQRESTSKGKTDWGRRRFLVNDAFLAEQEKGDEKSDEMLSY